MHAVTNNTNRKSEKIASLLETARENKLFPGCVVGFMTKNTKPVIIASGNQTYASDSYKIKNDTMYDVASITKSIPTAALALHLYDQKLLRLSDPLAYFIPEMNHITHQKITIFHLLTQSIDLKLTGRLATHQHRSPDAILQAIFQAPLRIDPGNTYLYANATSILLGLVVEKVSGKPLDVLADEVFFNPLGMIRTTFHPQQFNKEEIVPTEIQGGKLIQGIVHDESARTLQQQRIVGSAGLFSTVPDLLRFVSMVLQKGVIDGKRYFSHDVILRMATNQLDHIGAHTGLGWELNQRMYTGRFTSDKTISKTGFTGCVVVADLEKLKGFVLLSNFTYPKRKHDYTPLQQLRSKLCDIVFED